MWPIILYQTLFKAYLHVANIWHNKTTIFLAIEFWDFTSKSDIINKTANITYKNCNHYIMLIHLCLNNTSD